MVSGPFQCHQGPAGKEVELRVKADHGAHLLGSSDKSAMIVILRSSMIRSQRLCAALRGGAYLAEGCELWHVTEGELVPWVEGTRLELPVHEVHARTQSTEIEFLLNERDGDNWLYRRDPAVRRRLSRVFTKGWGKFPVLAPEVVLLYKSKAPRAADEHDLEEALPLLDNEAREWLVEALRRADERHPWIPRISK